MKKQKTYRVKNHLWQAVCERNIEYIAKTEKMTAETKMINAMIAIGLEVATDEKIAEYLRLNEQKD